MPPHPINTRAGSGLISGQGLGTVGCPLAATMVPWYSGQCHASSVHLDMSGGALGTDSAAPSLSLIVMLFGPQFQSCVLNRPLQFSLDSVFSQDGFHTGLKVIPHKKPKGSWKSSCPPFHFMKEDTEAQGGDRTFWSHTVSSRGGNRFQPIRVAEECSSCSQLRRSGML